MRTELRPEVDYSKMQVNELANSRTHEYQTSFLSGLTGLIAGFLGFIGFKEGTYILTAVGTVSAIAALGMSSLYFREGRHIRREIRNRQ